MDPSISTSSAARHCLPCTFMTTSRAPSRSPNHPRPLPVAPISHHLILRRSSTPPSHLLGGLRHHGEAKTCFRDYAHTPTYCGRLWTQHCISSTRQKRTLRRTVRNCSLMTLSMPSLHGHHTPILTLPYRHIVAHVHYLQHLEGRQTPIHNTPPFSIVLCHSIRTDNHRVRRAPRYFRASRTLPEQHDMPRNISSHTRWLDLSCRIFRILSSLS